MKRGGKALVTLEFAFIRAASVAERRRPPCQDRGLKGFGYDQA